MKAEDFDALALKVAKEMYDSATSTMSLQSGATEFARRLREEWLKGMEPVAWTNKGRQFVFTHPVFTQLMFTNPGCIPDPIPLYTMEQPK